MNLMKPVYIETPRPLRVRGCSQIVHQSKTQTQRGAKLDSIIWEGSSLVIHPTCSLYMSFTNVGHVIKTSILYYEGLYIEIIEAKIIFGERMWGNDS
jgi:hypothetical protein